jgi:hypothetical protein
VLADERGARPSPHIRIGLTQLALGEARAALGDLSGAAEAYREAGAEFTELPTSHPYVIRARRGVEPASGGNAQD